MNVAKDSKLYPFSNFKISLTDKEEASILSFIFGALSKL
jgi:hypothetical protein